MQALWGPGAHPCRPCACRLGLCEFMWTLIMRILRVLIYWCPHPIWLIPSFSQLFCGFLKSWGERFNIDIPLRAKCFTVSHYLYNVCLWVSIFVPICYRRTLLFYFWRTFFWIIKSLLFFAIWVFISAWHANMFSYFILQGIMKLAWPTCLERQTLPHTVKCWDYFVFLHMFLWKSR